MKALVLGADGLLGSHLARQLLDKGIEVRGLIYPGSDSPTLKELDIELIEGDLLAADNSLTKAVRGCEAVFHLAAITDIWATKELTYKVNLDGTRNLLDASLEADIKRFVFCGSASSFQFGSIDRPGDETGDFPEAYRGVAYMESKYEATKLVTQYIEEKGLDAVTVSPTFMLGKYDWRPSSGELIRQFINRGMSAVSPGGRNFAYASDVAAALVAALEKGKTGEKYIAGGANLTYFDFFSKVAEQAGVAPPKRIAPGPLVKLAGALGSLKGALTGKKAALNLLTAKLAMCGTYYTSGKAVEQLSMPQTPVETGIADCLDSLRTYGHIKG